MRRNFINVSKGETKMIDRRKPKQNNNDSSKYASLI